MKTLRRQHPFKTFLSNTVDLYCQAGEQTRLVYVEASRHKIGDKITLLPIDASTLLRVRGGAVISGAEYDARPLPPAEEARWALARCGLTP